jgi:hypothetical protein
MSGFDALSITFNLLHVEKVYKVDCLIAVKSFSNVFFHFHFSTGHLVAWPDLTPLTYVHTCHVYILLCVIVTCVYNVHGTSVENRFLWSGQARPQGAMLKNENGRKH